VILKIHTTSGGIVELDPIRGISVVIFESFQVGGHELGDDRRVLSTDVEHAEGQDEEKE
jgi:hypothetical protein